MGIRSKTYEVSEHANAIGKTEAFGTAQIKSRWRHQHRSFRCGVAFAVLWRTPPSIEGGRPARYQNEDLPLRALPWALRLRPTVLARAQQSRLRAERTYWGRVPMKGWTDARREQHRAAMQTAIHR